MKIARKLEVWFASALALSALACSGSVQESDEELSTSTEGLSTGESCDTVSANKTTSSMPGDWVTSSTYDVAGCNDAYRLDANNYAGEDYVTEPNEVHVIGYGDTVPTTKSECEKLRFGLYIWEKVPGGGTDFVGSEWKWGVWSGFCRVPEIEPVAAFALPNILEPGRIRVQENYRFAMSARRYSVSGNSSSSYVRRKIRSRVDTF